MSNQSITNPQIQKLHCLYRNLGIDSKGLLSQFTHGRTDSTAGLTKHEASRLITTLSNDKSGERKRKVIFSLAYTAGIIYGDTEIDKKLNAVKLNLFLKERGAVKKDLNNMNYDELNKTHRQLKAIIANNATCKDNKAAKAATDILLNELNIAVSNK